MLCKVKNIWLVFSRTLSMDLPSHSGLYRIKYNNVSNYSHRILYMLYHFGCFYVLGESEDIIILKNMYIVEYAFTVKFNDIALAILACDCTNLSVYTQHYS